MSPKDALKVSVSLAGGQVKMARDLHVLQPQISRWIHRDGRIPAEYVLACERLYGVSRHDLRPDLYPVEVPAAPPAWHGVDRGGERVSFNRNSDLQGRAA